jgi:hypothetical protein
MGAPSPRPGVDPVIFREALAAVAAPVAVVTSFDG